jgi:nucleoside-diphosphate-sugar epimerase
VTPKRALVTGAAGFVGANLVRRLLAEGHDVRAAVRPGSDQWRLADVDVERVKVDIRDRSAVEEMLETTQPEWIFHLAAHGAYSWQTDRRAILETTLLATIDLLEAAAARGFDALVQAGSSSEYGYKDHAPSEDEAPEPNSEYAAAKAAATLYAGYLAREQGLHVVTLRLYSVYGPWENRSRFIPTLVEHCLRGELPPLVNPDVARDFVFVDDVCDAFVRAATADVAPGSVYNVGSGSQTTVAEVVEIARRLFGVAAEPQWGSMPDRAWDTNVWVAHPARAERELGWRPRIDLRDGLAETADWLRTAATPTRDRAGTGRDRHSRTETRRGRSPR